MASVGSDIPRRGDVYLVRFDPAEGYEIQKTRPAVVLSINDINSKPLTVLVVPGSSQFHAERVNSFRNVVAVVPDQLNGLRDPTAFQAHQLRSVDKARLERRMGRLTSTDLSRIEVAVAYTLGIS